MENSSTTYVPPHKRQSNSQNGPSPTPEQLVPEFRRGLNLQSSKSSSVRRAGKSMSSGKKVIYADKSVSRWLAVPLTDDQLLPSSVRLVSVSFESVERKTGDKPLTLVNEQSKEENLEGKKDYLINPWGLVAERVHSDLISSFENMREQLVEQSLEETKPTVVARFGKLLFTGNPSLSLDSLNKLSISESCAKDLRRAFYTNIPAAYTEYIKSKVVPKLGVDFEGHKELYHVKLSDSKRPGSTLSCKCSVKKGDNKLELYKVELNQVRHLISDLSCLECNLDLRLALCTKRIVRDLTDEEKQSISDLIKSAILDPNVKGGLRWPLGKANSGGQHSVVGVWHTKSKAYSTSAMRLRVRDADRYDFLTSVGEVTREIALKLTGITRNLLEKSDAAVILTMLEDSLKLIRDQFLVWEGNIVSYCEL